MRTITIRQGKEKIQLLGLEEEAIDLRLREHSEEEWIRKILRTPIQSCAEMKTSKGHWLRIDLAGENCLIFSGPEGCLVAATFLSENVLFPERGVAHWKPYEARSRLIIDKQCLAETETRSEESETKAGILGRIHLSEDLSIDETVATILIQTGRPVASEAYSIWLVPLVIAGWGTSS